jgi:uncharacterized protein CbrC (UPF0167 family)
MELMPSFRYYQAPLETMADLEKTPQVCAFCGERRLCFFNKGKPGCGWCLQAGKFVITKDTTVGLILEDQIIGFDEKNQSIINIKESKINEFRRNPRFLTWNEVPWQVCCHDFMVYLGDWQPGDFIHQLGEESARQLFETQKNQTIFLTQWPTDSFGDWVMHVFRCLHCLEYSVFEDFT